MGLVQGQPGAPAHRGRAGPTQSKRLGMGRASPAPAAGPGASRPPPEVALSRGHCCLPRSPSPPGGSTCPCCPPGSVPLLRAEERPRPVLVQNSRLTPSPETLAGSRPTPAAARRTRPPSPAHVSVVPSPNTEGLGLPPGHLPGRPFPTGLKQTACHDARGWSPPPAFPRVQSAVRTQLGRTGGRGHTWPFAQRRQARSPLGVRGALGWAHSPLSGTSATPVLQGPARSPWVTVPRSPCPCVSPSAPAPAAPLPVHQELPG